MIRLKHIRGDIWQVSAYIEAQDESGAGRAPISIRFTASPYDGTLVFIRGWIWGTPVEDDSVWVLRSWLESSESEIRDLAGIGEP